MFFRIEAIGLLARALAFSSSSLLMQWNVWLPMLIGLGLMVVGNALTLIMPNYQEEKNEMISQHRASTTTCLDSEETTGEEESAAISWPRLAKQELQMTLEATKSALFRSNRQVSLFMLITFTTVLGYGSLDLLLQYSAIAYKWTYARVSSVLETYLPLPGPRY